jgi:L-threonylcarbamoyladenylate synthase
MIHAESLAAVAGNIQHPTSNIQHPMLRSPGLLAKHYSPKAKLAVLQWHNDAELKSRITHPASRIHVIAHSHIPAPENFANVSVIPHDAEAFARALYAELHRCDAAGAELIVVEAPPELPEWSGIADRLRRAAD